MTQAPDRMDYTALSHRMSYLLGLRYNADSKGRVYPQAFAPDATAAVAPLLVSVGEPA